MLTNELNERLFKRAQEQLEVTSEQGLSHLRESIEANPEDYLFDTSDVSFYKLICAMKEAMQRVEDITDRETYSEKHFAACEDLLSYATEIAQSDPSNIDAQHLIALISSEDSLTQLEELYLNHVQDISEKCWDNVYIRPLIRVGAALSRAYLNGGYYKNARTLCEELLAADPEDHLGVRYTLALCWARHEYEEKLDELDEKFDRKANPWMLLSRALVLYKLDRMPAAKRALMSFVHTYEGGAFALLQPLEPEPYLLWRPEFEPKSFPEAALACTEAAPILASTTEFLLWAEGIPEIRDLAEEFAENHGLDL